MLLYTDSFADCLQVVQKLVLLKNQRTLQPAQLYKIIFLALTAALHSLARLPWTTFLELWFIQLVCVCMQYFLCWFLRSLLCHILLLCLVKPVELLAGPSCELSCWWSRRLQGGPKTLINLEQLSSSDSGAGDGVQDGQRCRFVKSGAEWILEPGLNCCTSVYLVSGAASEPQGQNGQGAGQDFLDDS